MFRPRCSLPSDVNVYFLVQNLKVSLQSTSKNCMFAYLSRLAFSWGWIFLRPRLTVHCWCGYTGPTWRDGVWRLSTRIRSVRPSPVVCRGCVFACSKWLCSLASSCQIAHLFLQRFSLLRRCFSHRCWSCFWEAVKKLIILLRPYIMVWTDPAPSVSIC